MICKQCGSELREGALFCVKCGAKIEPEVSLQPVVPQNDNVCTNCGASLQVCANFCIRCGTPVINAQPAAAPSTRAASPAVDIQSNAGVAQPAMMNTVAAESISVQEESFQFSYLGGGNLWSFVFGSPLYLTVNMNQVTMRAENSSGSHYYELPCNEIVGFKIQKELSIAILLVGVFILVCGIIFAICESLWSILWFLCGIGTLINLFPTQLTFFVADGRKFGFILKKPKDGQIEAVNRLSAIMNTIVKSQPKVSGITKKQSQIKHRFS